MAMLTTRQHLPTQVFISNKTIIFTYLSKSFSLSIESRIESFKKKSIIYYLPKIPIAMF